MNVFKNINEVKSQLKVALECLDEVGFIEGIVKMERIAKTALEKGYYDTAFLAMDSIKYSLAFVKGDKPHLSETERAKTVPLKFIETVSCVFGVNSRSTLGNLGLSDVLDDYLINNKIDVERIEPYGYYTSIFTALLKHGHDDLYQRAMESWVEGWQTRIQMKVVNGIDSPDNSDMHDFLRAFSYRGPRSEAKLPEALDWKIVGICKLLKIEHLNLRYWLINGLLGAGLRHSRQYIIETCRAVFFEADQIPAFGDISSKEASRLLGFSKKEEEALAVLPSLLKYSAKQVKKDFAEFGLKKSTCERLMITAALGKYHQSSKFTPDQHGSFMAVLSTVCRGIAYSSDDKTLKVREVLNLAGFSDEIQFQIPCMKKRGGEILSAELGI